MPQFHDIAYCSSIDGNAPALLHERELKQRPFPAQLENPRMLADRLNADQIDAAAGELGIWSSGGAPVHAD